MSLELVPSDNVVTRLTGAVIQHADDVSLREVRDAVAGRNTAFTRPRAMAILFESDFPNKHHDFEAVLENPSEAPEMRYLAAVFLGRIGTPAATDILARHAGTDDEYVLTGVMRGLGATGGEVALGAVLRAREHAKGRARSEADFAAALIAYRLGLPGYELPVPHGGDLIETTECERPMQVTRADASEAEFCLRSIANQPLGIEFAERPMYQVRCDRNVWMILLNREWAAGSSAHRALERKALLGAVALRDPSDMRYSVAFLLLTSPAAADLVSVLVCRINGDVVLAGDARISSNRADFGVSAVARPGAFGVRIAGRFENGNLHLHEASATPTVRVKPRVPVQEE